jgi:hypothetical protein
MTRATAILAALIFAWSATAAANDADFGGQWSLTIEVPGAAALVGTLEIAWQDGEPVAWVENGPAPVTIAGNSIEVTIDSRDRQGFRFRRILQGELDDGAISGTMQSVDILESAAEFGENGSSWVAVRPGPEAAGGGEYSLKDYDGTWIGIRGVDIRKYTMDLTDEGKAWVDAYDARMDEPQKRCVSPGLVAAATWIFPFELIVSEERNRLTMLYEAFGLSRRVFMNRTEMPEFYPESSMGFSQGRLEDGELIIETTLLAASTRDFNGEPVSDNTRIVERYFLTRNGNRLNMVMHMHDPQNYHRPPIRRRAWDRNDEALIFPFECDPDSFFRQLFNEGRMQEYIDRAYMRP